MWHFSIYNLEKTLDVNILFYYLDLEIGEFSR